MSDEILTVVGDDVQTKFIPVDHFADEENLPWAQVNC